jgi:hypothetical protein
MSSEFINLRWDDVLGNSALRATGAAAAALAAWQPAGAGGLYLYEFTKAALKELHFQLQIPHSVAFGTVIKPHVHFTTRVTTATGAVRWQMEYTLQAFGQEYSAPATIGGTYTFDADNQDKHLIQNIDSAAITLPAAAPSAIMVGRIFRNGGVAPDTFDASVFLLGFDLHCQFDKHGTINEAAAP